MYRVHIYIFVKTLSLNYDKEKIITITILWMVYLVVVSETGSSFVLIFKSYLINFLKSEKTFYAFNRLIY